MKERKGEGESQSVSAGSNKRVNESNERSKRIIDFIAGLSYDYLFSESLNDLVQRTSEFLCSVNMVGS